MNELRVGVIGFGYTGQLHLATFQEMPHVHAVAVADPVPQALEKTPAGVERFADYRELLALDLDIVSVCVPTALHAFIACDALQAGKHVLVEKPIAVTVADAERMIAAAAQADRALYTGMTHRFYPEIRQAKHRVDDGEIGDIVLIRDSIFEAVGFLGGPSWYRSRELAGGGTVLSSGVHLVDRSLWFANQLPTTVSGFASNAMLGGEVEDTAQMSLGFDASCFAQLIFGWLAEPHPLVCDLELTGTRGSIVVHTWQGYELRNAKGVTHYPLYTTESHRDKVMVGLRGEIGEFCDAVRHGREPWPSVHETTRAVQVVEAFYEAVRLGTTVKIEGLRG